MVRKKVHWNQKILKGKNIEISAIWEKAKGKRLQRFRLTAKLSKKDFLRLKVKWVGFFGFFHDSEKSNCGLEWKSTRISAKCFFEKKNKTEARSYTNGNRQTKWTCLFLLLLTMRKQLIAWIVSTVELFETHCFHLCVLKRNRIFSFGGLWVFELGRFQKNFTYQFFRLSRD